ncbi:MAG TPA: hypothetical protein VFZ59_21170 [Verrucomicrobiae bacterium]|nr:hypothetical protein [Verrucomicrobiae bacterium]
MSKQSRPALEELMFFNPSQFRVREGIINSLERFGHPRLEESGDDLVVRVGKSDAQTLFVYDSDAKAKDPIGMVAFLRTSPSEIAIMHLAVREEYALQNRKQGDLGLGIVLIEKVKEIAARIVGVEKIIFFYRQNAVIRL